MFFKVKNLLSVILCLMLLMSAAACNRVEEETSKTATGESADEGFDYEGEDGNNIVDSEGYLVNSEGQYVDDKGNIVSQPKRPTTSAKSGSSTGSITSTPSGAVSTPTEMEAKDMQGRVFKSALNWSELAENNGGWGKAYWEYKREIEKKYNCKIQHVYMSYENIANTVITSIMAGGEPAADWFVSMAPTMLPLVRSGKLYPVSDLPHFIPERVGEIGRFNGKAYSVGNKYSRSVCGALILYNMDYFKSRNLPDLMDLYLNNPNDWTWAKLREIAKEATSGPVTGLLPVTSHAEFLVQLIRANGGTMVTRTGNGFDFKPNVLNNANVLNAMTLYREMFQDGSLGGNSNDPAPAFSNGQAAMMAAHQNSIEKVATLAKFNVGGVPYPLMPDNASNAVTVGSYGTTIGMPVNAKNPDDVLMVMNDFVGSENKIDWKDHLMDLYGSTKLLAVHEKYLSLQKASTVLYDYAIPFGGVDYALFDSLAKGTVTPQQAVTQLNQNFRNAIDSFKSAG
jgi:maltose-binding protein MalE